MRTPVQKRFDALVAEFTAQILELVRRVALDEIAPVRAASKRPKARPAPVRAPKAKAEPKVRKERKRPAPRVDAISLEEKLLRHLRSGVLMTFDDLGSLGATPAEEKLVYAAFDRLVARGLAGVAGEGADRLVFAARAGAKSAPPPAAPSVEEVVAEAAPIPVAIEESAMAAPSAEPPPVSTVSATPAGEGAGHPFVIRRKRAGAA